MQTNSVKYFYEEEQLSVHIIFRRMIRYLVLFSLGRTEIILVAAMGLQKEKQGEEN